MILPFLLYDLCFFCLASLLYGGAFGVSYQLGHWIWQSSLGLFYLSLPLLVLVFLLTLICEIALIRLLLPRLKPGHYSVPMSPGFLLWTLHFSLNRLISLQPLRNVILYSAILRFLAFRALGAKIAFDSSISGDVDLNDFSMLQIGRGSILGAYTMVTGHMMSSERIHLGRVVIGQNVNIGAMVRIGSGVEIGDKTQVGAETKISPLVTIGQGCTIEPNSFLPPGTRLADGETFPRKFSG